MAMLSAKPAIVYQSALVVLVLSLNVSAWAGDFMTNKALAEAGDAAAQYELALNYEEGNGVAEDKSQAKSWYSQACDNGNEDGCESFEELNEAGY